MTGRALLLTALLAACTAEVPTEPEEPYDRQDGPLESRTTEGTEGVVAVQIRITVPGTADLAALEARCRREVAAFARAEAARLRRPEPHVVPDALIRVSAAHEPRLRASRCTAAATAFGGENPLRPPPSPGSARASPSSPRRPPARPAP